MRRYVLALVLLVACTEGVGDGPSFGSGASGANPGATTSATSADSAASSGQASESDTTSGTGDAPTTTGGSSANDESGTSSSPTSSGDPTTGTPTTTDDSSGESSTSDSDPSDSGGTPLDPDLDIPDEGESCTTPGNLNECPGIAVCRFHTAEEGRCESCDVCGNLGAPCTEGTDCDILFACYAGRCTNICQLGTFGCGPIEDCLDVGHPTHGVCDPFA